MPLYRTVLLIDRYLEYTFFYSLSVLYLDECATIKLHFEMSFDEKRALMRKVNEPLVDSLLFLVVRVWRKAAVEVRLPLDFPSVPPLARSPHSIPHPPIKILLNSNQLSVHLSFLL